MPLDHVATRGERRDVSVIDVYRMMPFTTILWTPVADPHQAFFLGWIFREKSTCCTLYRVDSKIARVSGGGKEPEDQAETCLMNSRSGQDVDICEQKRHGEYSE